MMQGLLMLVTNQVSCLNIFTDLKADIAQYRFFFWSKKIMDKIVQVKTLASEKANVHGI